MEHLPIVEQEPYEIKINIQRGTDENIKTSHFNHHVNKSLKNIYPNSNHDQVYQESNLQLKGKPNVIKSKMHIASSLI